MQRKDTEKMSFFALFAPLREETVPIEPYLSLKPLRREGPRNPRQRGKHTICAFARDK
jgi:hypothetical protein